VATLDAFERQPVLENVLELERVGAERLAGIRDRFEAVGDVRAVGGFQAIEFVADPDTKERATELQHAVAAEACRRGVIADSSTTSLNVQPSLVMPAAALEDAYGIIESAIESAGAGGGGG
jgi:4-aminobutyrate aminotransferase-like enzyme